MRWYRKINWDVVIIYVAILFIAVYFWVQVFKWLKIL